jgi:TRAP-type uncharacterized transport system substrate-binding protein
MSPFSRHIKTIIFISILLLSVLFLTVTAYHFDRVWYSKYVYVIAWFVAVGFHAFLLRRAASAEVAWRFVLTTTCWSGMVCGMLWVITNLHGVLFKPYIYFLPAMMATLVAAWSEFWMGSAKRGSVSHTTRTFWVTHCLWGAMAGDAVSIIAECNVLPQGANVFCIACLSLCLWALPLKFPVLDDLVHPRTGRAKSQRDAGARVFIVAIIMLVMLLFVVVVQPKAVQWYWFRFRGISIIAGDERGGRYRIAKSLSRYASLSGTTINVVSKIGAEAGSINEINAVLDQSVDIGLIQGGISAIQDEPSDKDKQSDLQVGLPDLSEDIKVKSGLAHSLQNVRQVAAVFDEPLHLLAKQGINTIWDLGVLNKDGSKRQVNLSTTQSGSRVLAKDVLHFVGIADSQYDPNFYSYAALETLAKNGKLPDGNAAPDAIFLVSVMPAPIANMLLNSKMLKDTYHLLNIPIGPAFKVNHEYADSAVIPYGSYGSYGNTPDKQMPAPPTDVSNTAADHRASTGPDRAGQGLAHNHPDSQGATDKGGVTTIATQASLIANQSVPEEVTDRLLDTMYSYGYREMSGVKVLNIDAPSNKILADKAASRTQFIQIFGLVVSATSLTLALYAGTITATRRYVSAEWTRLSKSLQDMREIDAMEPGWSHLPSQIQDEIKNDFVKASYAAHEMSLQRSDDPVVASLAHTLALTVRCKIAGQTEIADRLYTLYSNTQAEETVISQIIISIYQKL